MTGSFSSTNVKVVDEAPSNVTRGKSAVVAKIASMLFRGSRQSVEAFPFASSFRESNENLPVNLLAARLNTNVTYPVVGAFHRQDFITDPADGL